MARLAGDVAVSASVVAPIVGNDNLGGGCYDPSTGKALWGVLNGSAFEVWRTVGDYRTLVTNNGSTEYLSTIDAGPWWEPATVALQRIGGTLYANVSGRKAAGAGAGQWIYRDTSTAQDGSGPWVKHGTVHEIASYSTSAQSGHFVGGNVGGEILVEGGLWATNCVIFVDTGSYSASRQGVATSSDGGVSWTIRLNTGFYLLGGIYGERWSRNFARFDGAWYVGGSGNAGAAQNHKSTDLTSWTNLGALGFPDVSGTSYPFYTATRIYRYSGNYSVAGVLQSADAAPEAMPAWVDEFTTTPMSFSGDRNSHAFPYVCNVGPNSRPLWAVCGWGQILALDVSRFAPPCRQWPRADGLAASSGRRRYPIDKSEQASPRRAGHYW